MIKARCEKDSVPFVFNRTHFLHKKIGAFWSENIYCNEGQLGHRHVLTRYEEGAGYLFMGVICMSNLTPSNKRNNNIDKGLFDVLDIDRIFTSFFSEAFLPALSGNANIKIDVMENEKEYRVEAELPGIRKEEINIDLKHDKLTISVQRSEEVNEERESYLRKERKLGSYSRVIHLPNAKEEGIKAKHQNGILTIIVPKLEEKEIRSSKIVIE